MTVDSYIDESTRVLHKKKFRTGVLPYRKKMLRRPPSIKVLKVIAFCEKRMKFLSASINSIYQKIDLGVGLTMNKPRKY